MMGWKRVLAALACWTAASCSLSDDPAKVPLDPALETVHAVFVGIDRYTYSSDHVADADFPDLKGAVNDVRRFKSALERLYGLDLDRPGKNECDSHNDRSTTLTDGCATRARIFQALDETIASLHPGDTLLFYFAGHGAQYPQQGIDQDSGYNGTILPSDARDPDGSVSDILDVELRAIKDRATRAGIDFVTIFDSCNSGTATRDAIGFSRAAPAFEPASMPKPREELTGEPESGKAGYWVHLAAAQDGEVAQETPSAGVPGQRSGVFTTALIDTLERSDMRFATFGDIIQEVRVKLQELGHSSQTPSGEGELTASLGKGASSAALFSARRSDAGIVMAAGSLSGITVGSRFALFASQADARAGSGAIAETVVMKVDGDSSILVMPAGFTPDTDRLTARETAHFFPPAILGVRIDLPQGAERAAVADALKGLNFAHDDPQASIRVAREGTGSPSLRLLTDDGTSLGRLGAADDPAFGNRLADALKPVARVRQLLALRTTADAGPSAATELPVTTCIALDDEDPFDCPPPGPGGLRRIGRGDKFTASVINRGTEPAFLYVLAISPTNQVTLVVPRKGELDQPIGPSRPYGRSGIFFRTPGLYRFVTIASDKPVRADALEQDGNDTRDPASCTTALEKLLCDANAGVRDPKSSAVGKWSAQVTTVMATQ